MAARVSMSALIVLAGCYESHELGPDAAAPCLAEGAYPVPYRIEEVTPLGCYGSPLAGELLLHVPVRLLDFGPLPALCSPAPSVTEVDECTWEVSIRCDEGQMVTGRVSGEGALHGRLSVGLGGECTAAMVLGP